MVRRKTNKIRIGRIYTGGDAPISIQSMTNTNTMDIDATIKQVLDLEAAGCDIVRLAIFNEQCLGTISEIKKNTNIPLVADIHFDYRLAIGAIKMGIDKLRINPGNIGSEEGVQKVIAEAKERNIPIRVGVNSGSLSKEHLDKYGNTPQAMGESALDHVRIIEKNGYDQIVVSLKASNVRKTVDAYRYISRIIEYPLHIGVTEAGTTWSGTIKSSIGIGGLLLDGIGDTLRVSLTATPLEEVKVGLEILNSLGIRKTGVEIISCPTCGRCNIDLIKLTNILEEKLKYVKKPINLAVMGCVVNGPGEAKEADIGIAGGKDKFVLFKRGKIIGTYDKEQAIEILMLGIQEMIGDGDSGHNTGV